MVRAQDVTAAPKEARPFMGFFSSFCKVDGFLLALCTLCCWPLSGSHARVLSLVFKPCSSQNCVFSENMQQI